MRELCRGGRKKECEETRNNSWKKISTLRVDIPTGCCVEPDQPVRRTASPPASYANEWGLLNRCQNAGAEKKKRLAHKHMLVHHRSPHAHRFSFLSFFPPLRRNPHIYL